MNTRPAVDVIVTFVEGYEEKARQAAKGEGDGKLYVPGYLTLGQVIHVINNPSCLIQTDGNNAKEPAYLSLQEGLEGRNADGSLHKGFIVIDVITREVVSVVDRDGVASFDLKESSQEILKGVYGGNLVEVTNGKGEKFNIITVSSVRGINIPVTVIVKDGEWKVILDNCPLAIKSVTKVTPVI